MHAEHGASDEEGKFRRIEGQVEGGTGTRRILHLVRINGIRESTPGYKEHY